MPTAVPNSQLPSRAGIGLRFPHVDDLLREQPSLAWLELLSDNHLVIDRRWPAKIEKLRQIYPMALHGVGLNLGGSDPLDIDYLRRLKQLASDLEITHISEHCCFTALGGNHFHDLLPLPFTDEAAKHVATRIQQAQDVLGERLLIENLSSYLAFANPEMSEAEFISSVAEQADCYLLVDINNLVVNQINHGWDARQAVLDLPTERIREFHLAGHKHVTDGKYEYAVDSHNCEIPDAVWALYQTAVAVHGNCPSLIEWDQDIPPLQTLLEQSQRAEKILAENPHTPADSDLLAIGKVG